MNISTKRFQLRTLAIKDVTERYLSWFSDTEYIEFSPKRTNMDELIQYIESRENREDVLFLAIFTDDGQHIGNIKYEPIDLENKNATIGVLIGEREWRGKGVAIEVVKACNQYLHKNHGIERIDLEVNKYNKHAMHVYQKIGFQFSGEAGNGFGMFLNLK